MIKHKVNQLKAGAVISYLQIAMHIIIGLTYTPVMIRLLGQSEYGLYNTVASTISMLSILRLGFNNSYIRYYSIYKKDDDQLSINRLNGLFLIFFSIIGGVALVCGVFLSKNLILVFSNGLSSAEYDIAKVLMLLLTVNLAVSFPMSVFSNIITANERFVFLKSLEIFKTVLGPMVTLPLLLMGFRSIAMVVVTLCVSLVVDVVYVIYVILVLNNKFVFAKPEGGLFKDLFVYTSFIAIELIVDQVNWNIDKVLLARYRGTAMVSIYSVGYSLYTYYQSFSSAISGVFTPRVHKIVNYQVEPSVQRKELTELFTKAGRIQFLVLALFASGVFFFGEYFITQIWAGPEYSDAYLVAVLLILSASIALIQNVGIEIQRAEYKHRFRSIVYFIMAILNLGVSIILCKQYGAIGSAIGTALSLIIANGIIMNIYYHLCCNIDVIYFWKKIGRLSVGLVIPVVFGIGINIFCYNSSTLLYLLKILLYVVVYVLSMWFIGMNGYEKNLLRRFCFKFRKE